MQNLLDDENERREALSLGQIKAHDRRKMNPVKRGRPIKASGVYYRHPIGVSEETFQYISRHRMTNHEPLGSVVHRLLMRKKEQAQPVSYEHTINDRPADDTNNFDVNKVMAEWRERHGAKYKR